MKQAAVVILILLGVALTGTTAAACTRLARVTRPTILWQSPPQFRSKRGFVGRRLMSLPRGLVVRVCRGPSKQQYAFGIYSNQWLQVVVMYQGRPVFGYIYKAHLRSSLPAGPIRVADISTPSPVPSSPAGREDVFLPETDPVFLKFYMILFSAVLFGIVANILKRYLEDAIPLRAMVRSGLAALIISPTVFLGVLQADMEVKDTKSLLVLLLFAFYQGYVAKDILAIKSRN